MFKKTVKAKEDLTEEEKLDIECEATNNVPLAGELKRIMKKAESESESFFCNIVTRRINGLIYIQAKRNSNYLHFTISDVTTPAEREEYSLYRFFEWLKKYYSLSGLKITSDSSCSLETYYCIKWER